VQEPRARTTPPWPSTEPGEPQIRAALRTTQGGRPSSPVVMGVRAPPRTRRMRLCWGPASESRETHGQSSGSCRPKYLRCKPLRQTRREASRPRPLVTTGSWAWPHGALLAGFYRNAAVGAHRTTALHSRAEVDERTSLSGASRRTHAGSGSEHEGARRRLRAGVALRGSRAACALRLPARTAIRRCQGTAPSTHRSTRPSPMHFVQHPLLEIL
jgi:hypothetical protein